MGLTNGVWNALIPAAKAQAHLSDGTLGIALFAVPVGLVLGAALAGRLVDRAGSAVLVRICGPGMCAAAVTPGLAGTLPELMAALFAVGVCSGTLDVASNAQGVRVEAAYGRPVMTSMHAFYSLGAICGALAGGAFAWAGTGLLPSLAVIGAAGAVTTGLAGRRLLPGPHPAAGHGRPATGAAQGRQPRTPPASRRQVRRLVLLLGLLGICALVGEGSAGDWSAVYLRDNLGTSAAVASLGYAAFSLTMTLGRGVGDQLIRRFGVIPVVRACGIAATAGLGLALATPSPAVTIAGFTAFGAGLSAVVPQVFLAGGRADPERPGSGLALVVGLGYTGMAAGPAAIGLVASRTGLQLALLIPLALAAWIAVAAPALRQPRGSSGQLPASMGEEPGATPARSA